MYKREAQQHRNYLLAESIDGLSVLRILKKARSASLNYESPNNGPEQVLRKESPV